QSSLISRRLERSESERILFDLSPRSLERAGGTACAHRFGYGPRAEQDDKLYGGKGNRVQCRHWSGHGSLPRRAAERERVRGLRVQDRTEGRERRGAEVINSKLDDGNVQPLGERRLCIRH